MATHRKHDLSLVDEDWRAGIKSVGEICADYELLTGKRIDKASLYRYFQRHGIKRDLAARIRAEALRRVQETLLPNEKKPTSDDEIIDKVAQTTADILISHRHDIAAYRRLAAKLLSEVDVQSSNKELFEELGEMLRSESERGVDKRNDIYQRVISGAGRTGNFKALVEVLKILVGLERQAFGMSDNANGDADKPLAESEIRTVKDSARRIAFVLAQAMKEQEETV